MECEYCLEEFSSKKLFEEHIHSCPLCEIEFKEPPYCQSNHIIHHHEEFYCKNGFKYFTESEKIKDHKKSCIICDRCYKKFKTLNEFCKQNKKCILKQLEKKNLAEFSVKSDSEENSNC